MRFLSPSRRLDPRAWPVVGLLIGMVALAPLSTDMYLASLADMTRVFQTDVATVQLTLSVFAVGMAVGMFVHGPLSDRFGRRPVLILSLLFYLVASLACMVAPDIETLVGARFIQALGACGGGVIGRAIVRDVWGRDGAARMLSHMASAMALAPALAPILGSYLHVSLGWQANFLVMAFFGGLLALGSAIFLGETNTHLDHNAADPLVIVRNTGILLRDRIFLANALVVAFSFAGLFSYLSGASFVVIDILRISPEYFGYTFLAVALTYLAGAQVGARLTHRLGTARLIVFGLGIALAGATGAMSLAWLRIETLWSVLPFACLQFLACAFIMPNGQAGALGPYARMAGTASSLMGFIQMIIGATAGTLVGLFHDGTTRPLMTSFALWAFAGVVAWNSLAPRRPA